LWRLLGLCISPRQLIFLRLSTNSLRQCINQSIHFFATCNWTC
jgi:hypothetical protein